jgi:SAM-dependent methyltransferase
MIQTESKEHWEKIYTTKQPNEVSWTQAIPQLSLDAIRAANLPSTAKIIDVGGGDSKLVDFLLEDGFTNLTVLDISAAALNRAKVRLGDKAGKVTWIESDILSFKPVETYDFWHDRAAFHFLTSKEEVDAYVRLVSQFVAPSGILNIGTFSVEGPLKCSGLPIKQYTAASLSETFAEAFELISSETHDHVTPFGTTQNFVFCSFRKK